MAGGSSPVGQPRDRFNAVKGSFVLMGVGVLLPWFAFLDVTAYWNSKLDTSRFYDNYMNYFTLLFTSVGLVAGFAATRYIHLLSLMSRCLVPMSSLTLIYSVFLILVPIDSADGDMFFYITLFLVFLSSISMITYECGLYTILSNLPSAFLSCILAGESFCGLFVALLNMVTIMAAPTITISAIIFFSVAVGTLFSCIVAFYLCINSGVIRYYYAGVDKFADEPLTHGSEDVLAAGGYKKKMDGVDNDFLASEAVSVGHGDYGESDMNIGGTPQGHHGADNIVSEISWSEYFFVMRDQWTVYYTIAVTCFVTYSLYPAQTARIAPVGTFGDLDGTFYTKLWVPVSVFVTYALTDFIARLVSSRIILPQKFLVILATLRLGYFPLILLCNGKCWIYELGISVDSQIASVFTSDIFPFLFTGTLGFTHGICVAQSVVAAPRLAKAENRPTATCLCSPFLSIGTLAGSFMSFGVRAMACGGNPFKP